RDDGSDDQTDNTEQSIGSVVPERSGVDAVRAVVAEEHEVTGGDDVLAGRVQGGDVTGDWVAGDGGCALDGEGSVVLGDHTDAAGDLLGAVGARVGAAG